MRTRHLSNVIPFCYSGSDSKEYTEEEGKALVLCDEAKGPRGSAYMHLKQTLLVICSLLRVFQMVCEDQCSACSKSLGSFQPSHPDWPVIKNKGTWNFLQGCEFTQWSLEM